MFFVLSFTAEYEGRKLNSLKSKLSLKNTANKKPSETDVFQNAQEGFRFFIDLLDSFTVSDMKVNESLSLFVFNEVTNLYDLHNLINIFKDESGYIDRFHNRINEIKKKSEIEPTYEVTNAIRFDYKRGVLSKHANMAGFCALETKTRMANELTNPILF